MTDEADLIALRRRLQAYQGNDKARTSSHTDAGTPPGGYDVDARIINLERDMTDVKVAMGKLETRLENIEKTMLTKGQTAVYALMAGLAVFAAGWWVVQQYLAPLVAALPK